MGEPDPVVGQQLGVSAPHRRAVREGGRGGVGVTERQVPGALEPGDDFGHREAGRLDVHELAQVLDIGVRRVDAQVGGESPADFAVVDDAHDRLRSRRGQQVIHHVGRGLGVLEVAHRGPRVEDVDARGLLGRRRGYS